MIRKPSILASNAVTPESFVAPGSGSGSGSELRLDSPVGFEGPVPAAPSNDHIHSTTALRSNLEPKNHYFSASTTAAAAAAGTTSAPGVAGGSDGERKIVVETTSTTDQKHRSYSDQTTTATNTTNTTSLYSRSSSLLELARYSFRETSRNKCGYLVGCSSVYLVVFTVVSVTNSVTHRF